MKSRLPAGSIALVMLMSVGITQTSFAATPKAGQKCSKLGVNQTYSGKKFTCIKSGSKLVWNKGAVIPKAASPKPSQSASVKFAPAAEAEQNLGCYRDKEEAFSLSGPLLCKNERWALVQNADDSVQSRAYRYVLERWNNQPEGSLTIEFYIDQTSGEWVYEIESGLRAGARFWGTSAPGSKPIPAFISSEPTFIEEALAKAGIKQSITDRDRNRNARGLQAGLHGGQVPYWDFLLKDPSTRTNVGYFQVGPHEYTHYAQWQLIGTSAFSFGSNAGPWFDEGLASFIGSALGPMIEMPHNQMDDWRVYLSPSMSTPLAFFNEKNESVSRSSEWEKVYPLGALATQAVVALVGLESVIAFYKDLGSLNNKEAAYKKNFKLESGQLVKLLQGYIDSIKVKEEWTLSSLEARYKQAIANG